MKQRVLGGLLALVLQILWQPTAAGQVGPPERGRPLRSSTESAARKASLDPGLQATIWSLYPGSLPGARCFNGAMTRLDGSVG
jgi:hypothetical protein